jgi:hypothetical protein
MAPRWNHGELLELEEDLQLAALVRDWDFELGHHFEDSIFHRFRSSIQHPSSSPRGTFHFLAVFRRYTVRLTKSSVRLDLHVAFFGGGGRLHLDSMFLTSRIGISASRSPLSKLVLRFQFQELSLSLSISIPISIFGKMEGGSNWVKEWRNWQEEDS